MKMFALSVAHIANINISLNYSDVEILEKIDNLSELLNCSILVIDTDNVQIKEFISRIYSKPMLPKDALILLSSLITTIPCYLYSIDKIDIYQNGILV